MNAKNGSFFFGPLFITAMGVVFGDIGTSPLYAFRECFHPAHGLAAERENVMGILSLIFWSLFLIVSVKYLAIVMRMDNKGEGGILSLMALAFPDSIRGRGKDIGLILGVFGAALLYGDGMITPAISVLGAVEGLELMTPTFHPFIIPISIGILVLLFSIQQFGTAHIGNLFGPIMLLWFLTLTVLGITGIAHDPTILYSMNPWYGIRFLMEHGWSSFIVMGSIFLVVTGGEALYADMGHFGIRPIRRGWFTLVLPALFLNYLGQGALVLEDPTRAQNPFYLLAPKWALLPLILLATFAAVIASQALISGAFSLTMQAIQLGYLPRLVIRHTSSSERGQIYMPDVNWGLMLACIALVLGFKSSSQLSAAYGIAVTLTMIVTTVLFFFASRRIWKWPLWKATIISGLFLVLEVAFFGGNFLKISHGGWFPLVMGACIFTLMTTWKRGRSLVWDSLKNSSLPLPLFLESLKRSSPVRVKGSAIFMSGNPEGTPIALLHNIKHNKVIHERVAILTILTDEVPHVDPVRRVEIHEVAPQFYRIIGHYGFMEEPNVLKLLEACVEKGLVFDLQDTTFFLSRETIIPTNRPGMALWRDRVFSVMSRNSQRATTFFHLPPNRVVEMGMRVEV